MADGSDGAMGTMALLTRKTPAAIAIERKSLQRTLENAVSKADAVEKRMAAYTHIFFPHLETHL
jgi:hypothetical protein